MSDRSREIPYYWGYYIIEGDTLKLQTYFPSVNSFSGEFKVEERWARILNDTTIHFFYRRLPDGSVQEMNETNHFKHCVNKPDSLNILMDDY